jgi:hypothetical protein
MSDLLHEPFPEYCQMMIRFTFPLTFPLKTQQAMTMRTNYDSVRERESETSEEQKKVEGKTPDSRAMSVRALQMGVISSDERRNELEDDHRRSGGTVR